MTNDQNNLDQFGRAARTLTRIYTTDPRVAAAFSALHGLGCVNLIILRGDDEREYHVDKDGLLIEPWPDEFSRWNFTCGLTQAQ